MSRYLIGNDLIVDSQRRSVTLDDIELNLPELSYRLLVALIEQAPNIISHDELMTAVWQDRVVSDENLKKRVSRLREALNDSSDSPKYFVAERGMGYRCIACVQPITEQLNSSHIDDLSETKDKKITVNWGYLLIILVAFTVSVTSYFIYQPARNIESVSTAPITDISFQAAQYYYRYNAKDNQRALSLYQEAIALNPHVSANYSGLANVYSQGYYQFGESIYSSMDAQQLSTKAINLAPDKPWGYNSLGFALYLNGNYQRSIKAFNNAHKLAPDWGLNLSQKALTHLAMGELVLAYQNAKNALELNPTDAETNTGLGIVFESLSMLKQATAMLEVALTINPNHLLAQSHLGQLALRKKDLESAKFILTKLTTKFPHHQFGHWLMGHYYLQQSDTAAALTSFNKAAHLGGRYKLPSQVYIATINKDITQLEAYNRQLESLILAGNQWAELSFSQAVITAAMGKEDAMDKFKLAIEKKFSHVYRLENLPVKFSKKEQLTLLDMKNSLVFSNKQKQLKRVPGY